MISGHSDKSEYEARMSVGGKIMTLLKVKKLFKQYGSQVVLENVNFEIRSGEIVGLVGRNGCGKTTLMKLILGLASPTRGNIEKKEGVKFGFLLDCKVFEFLSLIHI